VSDYSANFIVENGAVRELSFHKAFIDKKGIFRGIEICDEFPSDIAATLSGAAVESARLLASVGYFGPGGIDGFTYTDRGSVMFNPICEINARLTMGEVARSLHQTLGGRCGRMMLVVTGGADIPCEMDRFASLFEEDEYSIRLKKGIFPATPVHLMRQGKSLTAKRFVVYIAGDSSEECDGYESRMRQRLTSLRQMKVIA
jgi:hypothetical protein